MRKIKRFLILAISVIFIAAGAVNQGFSSFFLSLPFVIIFIYALKGVLIKTKIVSIIIAAIIIMPLAWKHENNKIIYPWIGNEFIASGGWEAIQYEESYTGYSYETLVYKGADINEKYVISKRSVPCDVAWELTRVFVHHPDLNTLYYPVFSIAGYESTISGYELNNAFKSQFLKHRQISSSNELQSKWTNNLSLLMLWPVIPILLSNNCNFFVCI